MDLTVNERKDELSIYINSKLMTKYEGSDYHDCTVVFYTV